ncbi:MAG: tRNA lysidine(34) synthetase TilS [Bacilli bacterium]
MEVRRKSDIFIDCKIPMHDRNIWPVVVDSNNTVVWLPGLKKSKFDKSKEEKYDIILKYY